MQTLISVIIPVYNSEAYLQECIQSVLVQTLSDFELLLIDDGSSDNSRAICEEISRTDSRIQYFPGTHVGAAAARNSGIMISRGEYLFFMDSDDVIHPCLLESLFQLLKKNNAVMATEEFLYTDTTANLPQLWNPATETDHISYTLLSNQEAIDCFISEKPVKGIGGIGGQMIRRNALHSVLFDKTLSRSEDTKFIYQILLNGASMVILHCNWYCYRAHAGQSSQIPSIQTQQSMYECQLYIRNQEAEANRISNAIIREGMLLTSLAMWHAQSKRTHDENHIRYLKKLAQKEQGWEYYPQVVPSARISFFLSFHFLPLYWLIHVLWFFVEKLMR